MRDIGDYEVKYQTEPCEIYQVKYRRKKVLELLEKYRHRKILEIGCGMEPLFEYYFDFDKMVIVEPSQIFVENAKKKMREAKRDIICIQGFLETSIEPLKMEGIEFDYIVLSSLLHEVEEPEKLLNAIGMLCTEDTIVHINVPNANSIHRLLAVQMGLIEDIHELSELQQRMQRNHVYDVESLRAIVEKCGFEVIESGTYFPKFFSAGQMEKMLNGGIIQENIFEGLDKMIKYMPEFGSEIYVQTKYTGRKKR